MHQFITPLHYNKYYQYSTTTNRPIPSVYQRPGIYWKFYAIAKCANERIFKFGYYFSTEVVKSGD